MSGRQAGHKNIWGTVPRGRRDAERGRGRGSHAWRAAGRGVQHYLYRFAGPSADDSQHVQDRRRADQQRHSRHRARGGDPCALHLWRPLGRDGVPLHGIRHAVVRLGTGGSRPGAGLPRRDAGVAGAVPPLLRRLPHLARGQQGAHHLRRDDQRDAGREARSCPSPARSQLRPSDAARLGAEPRRLLPGPRDLHSLLPGLPHHRAGCDGPLCRPDRPRLSPVRLRGRTGCGPRHCV